MVSDDHEGLRRPFGYTGGCWQRCYVHSLRSALNHLRRKANDDCPVELRWLHDRDDLEQARQDLAVWL